MYWTYTDYKQLMSIVERLTKHVVKETIGGYVHSWQDKTVDWSAPWQRIDYYDAFLKYTGLDLAHASEKELKKYAQEQNIDVEKHLGRGRLIDVIFKKKARPHLIEPGFLILPPVDIEPLAEDFGEALEYGMPPTAGFAYSERLFAFLLDKPVRETVFFPIMKPRSE